MSPPRSKQRSIVDRKLRNIRISLKSRRLLHHRKMEVYRKMLAESLFRGHKYYKKHKPKEKKKKVVYSLVKCYQITREGPESTIMYPEETGLDMSWFREDLPGRNVKILSVTYTSYEAIREREKREGKQELTEICQSCGDLVTEFCKIKYIDVAQGEQIGKSPVMFVAENAKKNDICFDCMQYIHEFEEDCFHSEYLLWLLNEGEVIRDPYDGDSDNELYYNPNIY